MIHITTCEIRFIIYQDKCEGAGNVADIKTLEAQLQQNRIYETATFGMGCFWGHEAYFGSLPGVMRTRVGFAGGTSPLPSYRCMGDHTETIEIDFDINIITYEDILKHFWRNHYPNRDAYKGRQYILEIKSILKTFLI